MSTGKVIGVYKLYDIRKHYLKGDKTVEIL